MEECSEIIILLFFNMYGVFDLMHLSPNFYVMSTLLLKQKQNGLCGSKQSFPKFTFLH